MRHYRRCAVLFLLLIFAFSGEACQGSGQYDTESSRQYSDAQLKTLAEKIGISSEIEIVKSDAKKEPLAILHAENFVNKKLASAYFDCSAVSAELLEEIMDVRERRAALERERNARILITNSVNFLSRGAISAPAFGYSINPQHLPTKGNILGSVANGTSTLLSVAAIVEARSGKSKSSGTASILAPIFFDDVPRDRYTPKVWLYLNSAPLGEEEKLSGTHRQRLVAKWIKSGLAPNPATISGRVKLRRLLEIEPDGLDIGELKKRELMLDGLHTTVLQMSKGLEQLSRYI